MSDRPLKEIIQTETALNKNVERLRNKQSFNGLGRYYSVFENIPALRGLWTASSVDQAGAMYDRSGQGRTLTYAGNPTIDVYNNLVPYWDYDGTGDWHSRPDEAGLDVLGTETYVATAQRGLTAGGWFWLDSVTSTRDLISKNNGTGNQRGFHLHVATAVSTFWVSSNGTLTTSVTGATLVTGAWYFMVGRFTPSVELALFVNGTKTTNVTSIPAANFGNTAPLAIGVAGDLASFPIDGRCAVAFLSAATLSDNLVQHLFTATRTVMGV